MPKVSFKDIGKDLEKINQEFTKNKSLETPKPENDLNFSDINKKSNHWKFTYFNYNQEIVDYLLSEKLEGRRYIKFGFETCPKTMKPHLQGWFWCHTQIVRKTAYKRIFRESINNNTSGNYIKAVFPNGMTDLKYDMDTYVSKDGNTMEAGTRDHQGQKDDLFECTEALKNPEITFEDCVYNHTLSFAKHFGNLQAIKNIFDKKLAHQRYRDALTGVSPIECHIIWGAPAGNGKQADGSWDTKTNSIFTKHGVENIYKVKKGNGDSIWFEGYNGEKVIYLDEFCGWMPWSDLLEHTDPMGYPNQIQIKNKMPMWALWTTVYILSNKPPQLWYKDKAEIWGAFERRIKSITYKGPDSYYEKFFPKSILKNGKLPNKVESDESSDSDTDPEEKKKIALRTYWDQQDFYEKDKQKFKKTYKR